MIISLYFLIYMSKPKDINFETEGVRYIIFEHDIAYSKKLIKGDEALFALARNFAKRKLYNHGQPCIEPYYNSTDYFDEYMWGRCLIVFCHW